MTRFSREVCPSCDGSKVGEFIRGDVMTYGPCAYCAGRGYVSPGELRRLLGEDERREAA